jgi:hypothetical protein
MVKPRRSPTGVPLSPWRLLRGLDGAVAPRNEARGAVQPYTRAAPVTGSAIIALKR